MSKYNKLIKAGNKAQIEKMEENSHKDEFQKRWNNFPIDISIYHMKRNMKKLIETEFEMKPNDDKIYYEILRMKAANIANYAHMIILKCDKMIQS